MTGVRHRARPLDLTRSAQSRQQQLVQPLPHAGLLPPIQPTPTGHAGAEAERGRQMPPGDPGVENKEDPLQRLPIRQPLAARITPTRNTNDQDPPKTTRATPSPPTYRGTVVRCVWWAPGLVAPAPGVDSAQPCVMWKETSLRVEMPPSRFSPDLRARTNMTRIACLLLTG